MKESLWEWYRRSSFWRLNVAVWCFFGVFAFFIRYALHQDFERAIGFTLLLEPLGMVLSGVLHWIYSRPFVGRLFGIRTAAILIACSLLMAMIQACVAHIMVVELGWFHHYWSEVDQWLIRILTSWLVYMGWSLGYFWLETGLAARQASHREEHARSEAQRMELQLLRSQLDPHFLFNSLNGIAAEVRPHPDEALEMVRELADYLRYSLDQRHRVATPLEVELHAMRAYLRIEQARFGDDLVFSIETTPEALESEVPSFLLQPLVENAMKHQKSATVRPWNLEIHASRADESLTIEVVNSGSLAEHLTEGVGLETLRRRLELLYPERHEFHLTEEAGRVRAVLKLEGAPCFA